MKFILKDEHIYLVENHGFPNNKIEGEVVVKDIIPKVLQVSINDRAFEALEKPLLILNKKDIKGQHLKLVFKVLADNTIHTYTIDPIPLTHMVMLGEPLDKVYPEKIVQMEKSLAKLNQYIKGQTKDLKDTMVELVDTFEDITRKGSLF